MKQIKLLVLFFLAFAKSNAQQNIVASGSEATGSGGSASYSIGQIDYITATGTGGAATQGVQQPFEIVTLVGEEFTDISLKMIVYPNPTISFVNLRIDNFNFENLSYEIINLNGRMIANKKITESETQIKLENLSSAIYLLNVNDQNKTIKTFKIIKSN